MQLLNVSEGSVWENVWNRESPNTSEIYNIGHYILEWENGFRVVQYRDYQLSYTGFVAVKKDRPEIFFGDKSPQFGLKIENMPGFSIPKMWRYNWFVQALVAGTVVYPKVNSCFRSGNANQFDVFLEASTQNDRKFAEMRSGLITDPDFVHLVGGALIRKELPRDMWKNVTDIRSGE